MGDIVAYAIVGLVVIIFGVLVGFSFKVWRIPHALLAIAVFLATGWFLVMSAATLKTEDAWRSMRESYVQRLESQREERIRLERGQPGDPESVAQSLHSLRQQLRLEMIGRGLVWRGMKGTAVDHTDGFLAVTLNTTGWGDEACITPPAEEFPGEAPPAEAAEAQPPRPHGITPGMVLTAFREQSAQDVGLDMNADCHIPSAYLGQFRVMEAAEDSPDIRLVSLLPEDEMLPSTVEAVERASENLTWTLYGSMPIDRHGVFADLSDEELRQLLPAATVEQYVRDFEPAREDDPEENVWTRIRFTQPYTLTVDTPTTEGEEAPAEQPPAEPGEIRYFDAEGRAIFPEIRHGGDGTVSFEAGTEIVVPTAAAEALVAAQVAEEVEKLYVRPLRHYPSLLADMRVTANRYKDQLATLGIDIERNSRAIQQATSQLETRGTQRDELRDDRDGYRQELGIVTALQEKLTADFQRMREEYRALYVSVRAHAEQLRQIQFELERQMEEGRLPSPAEPDVPPAEQTRELATAGS